MPLRPNDMTHGAMAAKKKRECRRVSVIRVPYLYPTLSHLYLTICHLIPLTFPYPQKNRLPKRFLERLFDANLFCSKPNLPAIVRSPGALNAGASLFHFEKARTTTSDMNAAAIAPRTAHQIPSMVHEVWSTIPDGRMVVPLGSASKGAEIPKSPPAMIGAQ